MAEPITITVRSVRIDQAALMAPSSPLYRGFQKAAGRTRDRAKVNLTRTGRIDTGRARNSIAYEIQVSGPIIRATVGSDVTYFCIFGSKASVVTDKGRRTIGQIKVGDLVMTQSGDFRPVTATNRFPVTEKPDLVEIHVPWRAGKSHELTVTADHRMLVERDGRNKWVQAHDLRYTDLVHVRRKISPRRGTALIKTCAQCEAKHTGQGWKFCSIDCREAYYRAHGHPVAGRPRGAEFSARQSVMRKKMHAERPESHPNRNQSRASEIEKTLGMWLIMRGLKPVPKMYVDGLWPDFYVESEHRIYEADGAYWHKDQARDIARDAKLQAALPGVEIVHVHFFDERHSPTGMVSNPMPGVWYVAVNPSPESYVEPTVFMGVHPTMIRRYTWKYEGKPKGSVPYLYDLSVEGEHSFLASGILVSNSYLHNGTANNGQGFIYPRRATLLRFKPRGAAGYVYAKKVRGIKGTPVIADAIAKLTEADFTV